MQHADRRFAAADMRHGREVDYDTLARQDEQAKVALRVAEFEDRLLEAEERLIQLLGSLDVIDGLRHLLGDPTRLEVASTLLSGVMHSVDVAAPTPPMVERSCVSGPLKARTVMASPKLVKQPQQEASTTMEEVTIEDDSRLSASGNMSPMPVKVDQLLQPIREDITDIRIVLETLEFKVDEKVVQKQKHIEELMNVTSHTTYDRKVQFLEERLGRDTSAMDNGVCQFTDSIEALKIEFDIASKRTDAQLDELSSSVLSLTSDHEVLEARLGARVAALERDLERQMRALQGHIAVTPQPSPKASRQASREASPDLHKGSRRGSGQL